MVKVMSLVVEAGSFLEGKVAWTLNGDTVREPFKP